MADITLAEVQQLLREHTIINDLFDTVRVVEGGGTCRLCDVKDGTLVPNGGKCHELWHRSEKCANCVSRKACIAGQKMVKLEYVDENYYFVIAKPFDQGGKMYILEFITNITTRLTTDEGAAGSGSFVHDLISQLELISEHEAFTGLYNKPYLEKNVTVRLLEGKASGRPLFMGIYDIDDFKYINDLYGHVQGDAVLLRLAEILAQHIAGRGYAARFGGDEFVVVFDGDDESACAETLLDIKNEFDSYCFRVEEMQFRATTSCGLAEVSGVSSFAQALDLADKQLYYSKQFKPRRGGNTIKP